MSWVGVKLSPRDLAKIAWTIATVDGAAGRSCQSAGDRERAVPVAPSVVSRDGVDGYGYSWFSGTLKADAPSGGGAMARNSP